MKPVKRRRAKEEAFKEESRSKPLKRDAKQRNREYFLQVFRALGRARNENKVQPPNYPYGFLTALRQQPDLAAEKIAIDNESRYPLGWLIQFRETNLDVIRTTFKSFPQALYEGHMLHQACKMHMKPAIIKFLAQSYPAALSQYDAESCLPVRYIVRRPKPSESADIIQFLLKLNSQDLLQQALAHNFPPDIVDAILQNYPNEIVKFKVSNDTVLDQTKTAILCRIFPQMKVLDCSPRQWADSRSYQKILESVQNCNELLDFSLKNIPHEMQTGNSLDSLRDVVEMNKFLRKLQIYVVRYGVEQRQSVQNRNNSVVRALSKGLDRNRNLQMLVLGQFAITDAEVLNRLMNVAPMALMFDNAIVEEGMDGHDTRNSMVADNCDVVSCRLKILKMQKCALSRRCYEMLLHLALPRLPQLQRLELHITLEDRDMPEYELNVTQALVEILKLGKLVFLSLTGEVSMVDVGPICEALKTNSSLSNYNIPVSTNGKVKRARLVPVLEDYNATLAHVVTDLKGIYNSPIGSQVEEKIWYWTTLNKYGRSKVRQLGISKQEFMTVLDDVNALPSDQSSLYRSSTHDIERSVLLYGLLRESPSVWSNFIVSYVPVLPGRERKRKRGFRQ